jgi:predicted SAM-dependent methyltransferase
VTRYTPRSLADGRTMLNVGCGNRYHPHWTNIDHIAPKADVIAHDITSGLPFADNSFDVVYHSHVLEHLKPEQAKSLLRECHRVLKPDGILRVLVPDLEFSAHLYLKTLAAVSENPTATNHEHYEWGFLNLIDQMVRTQSGGNMAEFISRDILHDIDFIVENGGGNTIREIRQQHSQPATPRKTGLPFHKKVVAWIKYRLLRQGRKSHAEHYVRFRQTGEVHQWMYDRYSLKMLLSECGFTDLKHCTVEQSQIIGWTDFHLDIDPDGHSHKPYSLVYEGRK